MTRTPPLFVVASLVLASASGHAMTVTSSTAPPSGTTLLARDVATDVGSYACSRGLGAGSDIGQTFRLSRSAELDRITIRARPETDVAGTLVILYFGTFSDPGDVTMDELLAAEIAPLPTSLPVGSEVYLTFDLPDRALQASRQYGFVLGFSGGDHPGEARLEVLHVGQDAYAGGQAVEWTGLQELALANDLVFYLQETSSTPSERLLLLDGRFAVDVRWETADGSGIGHPVPLTAKSGYFWFFRSDNVEVLVKVLDACADPWQRYWVFASGLTDVGVSLRVVDLVANYEHTYRSDPGRPFQPVVDTATFATCSEE